MRDALSLLDQAIAHAAGTVRAEDVRQMLGLADRARIVDLFEALMSGDMADGAQASCATQYDIGADPAVVLSDLAEFTHFVTRVKVVPAVADDVSLSEAERARGRAFAAQAVDARAVAHLADAAQGHRRGAGGRPAARRRRDGAGAHRLCRRPADAGRSRSATLGENGARGARAGRATAAAHRAPRQSFAPRYEAPRGAPRSLGRSCRRGRCRTIRAADAPTPAPTLAHRRRFEDADRARRREARHPDEDRAGARRAAGALRGRPARDRAGAERAARRWCNDLSRKLSAWTGKRWMVVVSAEQGAPTVASQAEAQRRPSSSAACAPIRWCRRCSTRFPGAEIVGVHAERRRRPLRRRRRAAADSPDDDATRTDAMADFMGMMKQAAQLQSKMQAMQAELDQIEVEGTAGGGMVTVTLTAKGEMKGVHDRRLAAQARREGDPRGPAGRRACRRAPQGRGGDAGKDEEPHRRPAAAAGLTVEVSVLDDAACPPPVRRQCRRIERLIQLLARLPGLGPRSARRAALHLIKKREQLMAPLAAALADRDRQDRDLQDLRQYRHAESLHGLHRSAPRPLDHRRGGGRRRPVGAGARACASTAAITCSAARCRRSTASARRT